MTKLFEDWSVISSSSEYEDDLVSTVSTNNLEDEGGLDLEEVDADVEDEDAAAAADTTELIASGTSDPDRPAHPLQSSTQTLKIPIMTLGENSVAVLDTLLAESTPSISASDSDSDTPETSKKGQNIAKVEEEEEDEDEDEEDKSGDSHCDTFRLCPYVAMSRLCPHAQRATSKWILPVNERITLKSAAIHNALTAKLNLAKTGLSHDYVIVNTLEPTGDNTDNNSEVDKEVVMSDSEDVCKSRLAQLWDETVLTLWVNPLLSALNKVKPEHLIYFAVSILLLAGNLQYFVFSRFACSKGPAILEDSQITSTAVLKTSTAISVDPRTTTESLIPTTDLPIYSYIRKIRWGTKPVELTKVTTRPEKFMDMIYYAVYNDRSGDLDKGWRPSSQELRSRVYGVVSDKTTNYAKHFLMQSRETYENTMKSAMEWSSRTRKSSAEFWIRSKGRGIENFGNARTAFTQWVKDSKRVSKPWLEHLASRTQSSSTQAWSWLKETGANGWTQTKQSSAFMFQTSKQMSELLMHKGTEQLEDMANVSKQLSNEWKTKGWPYSKQKIASLGPLTKQWINSGRNGVEQAAVSANVVWVNSVAPTLKQQWHNSEVGARVAMYRLKRSYMFYRAITLDLVDHAAQVADEMLTNFQ